MQILLVEDDVEAAGHVGNGLREAGYTVKHCSDGEAGLAEARAARYDLLIVDRMLPQLDGLALVGALRRESVPTPVLVLSALGTIDDRVEGLRAGGDDYLVKPFAFAELLARVEALLRRASGDNRHAGTLRVSDLEINLLTRRVTRAGRNIDLTAKEFQLLEFLVRRVDQIVTRTMLLEAVWNLHFDPQTNLIDVHISRLRQAIDRDFSVPLLHTIRGTGYSIKDPRCLKAPRFLSSTARLALWYMCGVAVGVSVLLWSAYLLSQRALELQVDLVVKTEIESLREDYRGGGLKRLIDVLEQRDDDWGRLGAAYLLVDRQGAPLGGNLTAWPTRFVTKGAWLEFDIDVNERGRTVDHPVRAAVVMLDGNRLLVGTDVSERRRFAQRLRATTYWGIGLTVALMAITAWWFSRRVAARVRAVAQACDSIISGDLTRRLPFASSADEFDQLAGTVNGMLDRIEQQTAAVRVTFNSAAHDLRAPLYRMRTRLEATLQGSTGSSVADATIQATLDDLERVQRTLTTLLQIAQAESGSGGVPPERLDLAQMGRELAELYAPEARARNLALRVAAPAPAMMKGHQQLLAQLLTNLLENAIKYVPAGGTIEIEITTDESLVKLSITDDGPGIPELSQAAMLLPFRRLERDSAAPGSGLGLSLVAAVVRLHHGHLELRDMRPGLRVCCSFAALSQ